MGIFGNLFGSRNAILIHTDKQQYYAGETVTGMIMLSVIDPVNVDSIFLKVKGIQEARFSMMEAAPRPPMHSINHNSNMQQAHAAPEMKRVEYAERDTFFTRRVCIHAYRCVLACGSYTFPFQFQLDHGLPGTFGVDSHDFGGLVRYRVKAEVVVPGLLKPNIKHSQDILINQPLERQPTPTDTYKEGNVRFCCCISKGHVSMLATIDKNAYMPGEAAILHLLVDNSTSEVDIKSLRFTLIRRLRLSARGHSISNTRVVAHNTSAVVRAGERADRYIKIVLPQNMEPSTRASLIDCSYVLSVELALPFGCNNISVVQEVAIFAPPLPGYTSTLQYPQGWNPVMMPTVMVSPSMYQPYTSAI